MRDNSNHTLASQIVEKRNGIGSYPNGTSGFEARTYAETDSVVTQAAGRPLSIAWCGARICRLVTHDGRRRVLVA